MTLKRMNNVLIVVDDLEAAKAFFIELGLKLEAVVVPEAVLPAIVETVAQTLKLPYAAVALRRAVAVK